MGMSLFRFTGQIELMIPGTNDADAGKVAQEVIGSLRHHVRHMVEIEKVPVLVGNVTGGTKAKMLGVHPETLEAMAKQPELFAVEDEDGEGEGES